MPLLFPEHQQKVVTEARVHDDPVSRGGEVHVCGQEDYLSSLQDIYSVRLPQVGHHHLQVAFPLAGEQGARAGRHLGDTQLLLLVVEVVRVGVVAEVAVGMVMTVVGQVVMGAAALLWCTLSDSATVGHILSDKEKAVSWVEVSLPAWLRLPGVQHVTSRFSAAGREKLYFLENESCWTVTQRGGTILYSHQHVREFQFLCILTNTCYLF